MRLDLTRAGASAAAKPGDLTAWRQWAYEEAQAAGVVADGPVKVQVWATARDARARPHAMSCFRAVESIIDGLIAGGVLLAKVNEIVELTIYRPKVTGVDGIIVRVTDAHEPF